MFQRNQVIGLNENKIKQESILLGTHGEDYRNWMPNPVFISLAGLLFWLPLFCISYFIDEYFVCSHNTGAIGVVVLDRMDSPTVCFWQSCPHGTGASSC